MRIGVYDDEFPSPSGTFILGQIEGLLARGHDVRLLAQRSCDPPFHEAVARLGLLDRTRYPFARNASGLLAAARSMPAGVLLRSLDPLRFRQHATSLRVMREAGQIAAEGRLDVLLCQHGHRGRLAARLCPTRCFRCPFVTVFHGGDITTTRRKDKYAQLFARGDLMLANSAFTAARLEANGCPAAKITTLPMGVDLSRFTHLPRERDIEGPLRLVSVARLVEVKGIEHAVRAVAALRPELRDRTTYTILGGGPLEPSLRTLAESLGVGDRVVFLGRQTHERVRQEVYRADVMVMPSIVTARGEQEALGVAAMEALATGIPVIATRTGGLPEVVPDGTAGLLVPPEDAGALAEAVQRLADDETLRARLGEQGRAHVETTYNLDTLNARLEQVLRSLVGG